MKTKSTLLVLFLLIAGSIIAQDFKTRSLEAMGYRNESIMGINGAISYFIKLQPRDDVDRTNLILQVRPSQVLREDMSTITVSLKDEPVYTTRLSADAIDSVMTIVIPLNKRYVQEDGRFIKLRIDAKMAMSDEYCKDVDNPAVWVTIRNSSYLEVVKQDRATYNHSLKETISEFNTIATPINADLDDLTSGGVLFALLKEKGSLEEIITTNFRETDSSFSNMIVTGTYNKLPGFIKSRLPDFKIGQGLIKNITLDNGQTVLVVTGKDQEGYRKAIYTLTNYKIINASFSNTMLVDAGAPSYFDKNQLPVVFSLEELGGTPKLMEGIGALKTNYAFSLADYNAIPKKLTFHLEAMLSMLKEGDRGFLNVYLNDNLVFSTDLHDKTSFSGDIELKPYLLTKNNSLVVEMRFHGAGGICKEGFSNFFGFIDTKTSNLVFSGEKVNEFYNFFNYPGEFRKKALRCIVTPSLIPYLASSFGELIYQLNTATLTANYLFIPQVVSSDKANLTDMANINGIALLHRNDPLIKSFEKNLPVQFNRDFQLYKDISGETSYSINDFSNSGIAQIFRQGSSTFLLISSLGDSSISDAFEGVIKSFGSQYSAIESNVCIANSKGKSNFFFKLPDNAGLVTYKGDKNNMALLWNKYKYFLLAGLVVLLVLGFFFVRKRVKQSQEII
jgi:hypothetical protein